MGFTHIHEYSPDGFNNMSLSEGCVLEVAPSAGTVGGPYIPKTGVRGKEPVIDWVQLEGHLEVISCQGPPPTGHPKHIKNKYNSIAKKNNLI